MPIDKEEAEIQNKMAELMTKGEMAETDVGKIEYFTAAEALGWVLGHTEELIEDED